MSTKPQPTPITIQNVKEKVTKRLLFYIMLVIMIIVFLGITAFFIWFYIDTQETTDLTSRQLKQDRWKYWFGSSGVLPIIFSMVITMLLVLIFLYYLPAIVARSSFLGGKVQTVIGGVNDVVNRIKKINTGDVTSTGTNALLKAGSVVAKGKGFLASAQKAFTENAGPTAIKGLQALKSTAGGTAAAAAIAT
jgi:hypothetical protein